MVHNGIIYVNIKLSQSTFQIMTTSTNVKYEVYYNGYICKNPQYTVGYYSTIKRARNKATKLDNEYGGYAYNVRRVDATTLRPIRDEVA